MINFLRKLFSGFDSPVPRYECLRCGGVFQVDVVRKPPSGSPGGSSCPQCGSNQLVEHDQSQRRTREQ